MDMYCDSLYSMLNADAIYLHTRLFCAYRSNVLIAIININMFTYTVDLL